MDMTIGMIGVGNMASALAKAIRRALPSAVLLLNNRTESKITSLAKQLNGQISTKEDIVNQADIIFIGVKPSGVKNLFEELNNQFSSKKEVIWVSMAAGLSLEYLTELTPSNHGWIRMMPNTPVEVGKGTIGYASSPQVNEDQLEVFKISLSKAGSLIQLEENQFDAFTGLAGSSPAFIYQLIEAMSDVGVQYGFNRADSIRIAASAVEGAAKMVQETGTHPAELKDKITSPSGTTIEGVVTLEEHGFRHAIIQGVAAAIKKSKKMSK